ncbi:MAG: 3-deoxy-D-manno-octulosonic acid transferase [Rhizomicrobium sp.]
MRRKLPFGLAAYRFTTRLLTPAVPLVLRRRLKRGKESGTRAGERLGRSTLARPTGQLVWIHGASVGECMAALPLIDTIIARTGARVLVTSGTVTSAAVMASRLPKGAFHQFVPVDTPSAVARFLSHWHPDLGLFVDSDAWPNLVLQTREMGIPLAIVNGRMSARSFAGWRRARASAKALFGAFSAVLAQDDEAAARFRGLGAHDVQCTGSLKADAPVLPANAEKLTALKNAIGNRPVFLAAQTHGGEEETILPARDLLAKKFPNLLTIIVPRHPERGGDIAALCATRRTSLRSRHDPISADTAIYIADTIGELGLFYRLAPFAFIGGSLIPHGGQNPLEPAKLGRAVLAGPHTDNFIPAYDAIFAAQGTGRVRTAGEISAQAAMLLADANAAEALGEKAAAGAASLCGAVERTAQFVAKILDHART